MDNTNPDNSLALDELLGGYGSPPDSSGSEDSAKGKDSPSARPATAELSFGATDIRLKDPNFPKMMVSQSCGSSPVSVVDTPETRVHHSTSGAASTPVQETIVWSSGMSCPVVKCQNHKGHQFRNLNLVPF